MRKLLSVPVVACLTAMSPALASPGGRDIEDVPSLVDVSRVPRAPLTDAPALAAPSAFARHENERSDNMPPLISSAVAGDPLDHQEARDRLLAATRGAQQDVAREREAAAPEPAPLPTTPEVDMPPQLEAIAACESGGDPSAIGGGGAYRGKYQFSPATWAAVGGSGDPAAAPEAEQDRRAALLYAQSGASQWPVCGG